MKSIGVLGVVLFAFIANQAIAACPTTGTASRVDMRNLLSGRYACAVRGNETWDELHQGTSFGPSNVQDYKKGPTDPVDPSEVVGTYTINNGTAGAPDSIAYNYGTGGSYTYVVTPAAQTLGVYSFCNTATSVAISVTVAAAHC